MLKVDFRILTISIPQKAWFRPISIPFFYKNAPNLGQIVCFFGKIFGNTPNLQIGRIGSVTKIHPSIYQNYENAPQNLWASPYTICQ